jgi:hypothetical protein
MMGNVVECSVDDVHVGLPVEVFTVKLEDGLGIPFWRPAAG